MLATDEDALVCDLAETYGILDLEALPVQKLAVLSCGLRDNSRIKLKLAGMKIDTQTFLMAGCYDVLTWLCWTKTESARNGGEPPNGILVKLMGIAEPENVGYATAEEFWQARDTILKEAQENGY